MLAGNVVALLSPLIFIPVLTYAFGKQNYDWESMKMIRRADDSDMAKAAHIDLELTPGASNRSIEQDAHEQAKLKKAALIARSLTVFMTLALLVVWPMPMYGSGYIFSKKFFTGKPPCLYRYFPSHPARLLQQYSALPFFNQFQHPLPTPVQPTPANNCPPM